LLADHAPGVGSNRDICHALMFDTPRITPTEIDSRRSGQVQRETRHEQIIVSRHGALN
jgi:hypothetical protein